MRRLVVFVSLLCFLAAGSAVPAVHGQDILAARPLMALSQPFTPAVLKGLRVYPDHPFRFDFILDKGNSRLAQGGLIDESNKLIRYFLAALTIPEKDLWVNLSPYEKDRIITDEFSTTEMGRDLLAQDFILKQVTAALIHPESFTGKDFWQKVYASAYEKYGTTDIPLDTFNKVWILPAKAQVYENGDSVFVTGAALKVMLESDYLAAMHAAGPSSQNNISRDILRNVVLPMLEKEVNEGENFAPLRQVYFSLILAKWYKETLKASIINLKYSDKKKVYGVDLADKGDREAIYRRYLDLFRNGVFNYVKEVQDPFTREVLPRKYFAGGCDFAQTLKLERGHDRAVAMASNVGVLLLIVSGFVSPLKAMEAAPQTNAPAGTLALVRKKPLPVNVEYGLSYLKSKLTVSPQERVIIIDPTIQMLYVLTGDVVVRQYPVSTGAAGIGTRAKSGRTPPGIHVIMEKIGEGAASGQRYLGRVPVDIPLNDNEDGITTRILRLAGIPGEGNLSSWKRNIYIHGTNREKLIGRPASHGCIRMRNSDVKEVFGLVREGARVMIIDPQKCPGVARGKPAPGTVDPSAAHDNRQEDFAVGIIEAIGTGLPPGHDRGPSAEGEINGGIDFDPARFNLERSGRFAPPDWSPDGPVDEKSDIQGLVPVIFKIDPVGTLSAALGPSLK